MKALGACVLYIGVFVLSVFAQQYYLQWTNVLALMTYGVGAYYIAAFVSNWYYGPRKTGVVRIPQSDLAELNRSVNALLSMNKLLATENKSLRKQLKEQRE